MATTQLRRGGGGLISCSLMERTVGRDGGKSRTQVNKEMREGPNAMHGTGLTLRLKLGFLRRRCHLQAEERQNTVDPSSVSEFEVDFFFFFIQRGENMQYLS